MKDINKLPLIAVSLLSIKWFIDTQLKPTGIIWYVNPKDHPDSCECSRKCLRRKMSHDAAMNNWALLRKPIRFYRCKVCNQGFYSWKKRSICKRFSCFRDYNPNRKIKGTTVTITSSKS